MPSEARRIIVLADHTLMSRNLARGVSDYASKAQYSSIQCISDHHWAVELMENNANCYLIGILFESSVLKYIQEHPNTYVNISTREENIITPAVCVDDRAIGKIAADFYLNRGYQHFLVYGPITGFGRLRRKAFQDQLQRHDYMAHFLSYTSDHEVSMAAELIQNGKEPLAVFAASDYYASTFIIAMRTLGYDCPSDYVILGVDNDDVHSTNCLITITSIDPNFEKVGYLAAEKLDKIQQGLSVHDIDIVAPLGVVIKQSTEVIYQDEIVSQSINYIKQHLSERVDADTVADHLGYSRRTLERRFQAHVGVSVWQYIKNLQMNKAQSLLRETNESIISIALQLGYKDQRYFSKDFKKYFQMTPSEYRASAIKP